MSFYTRKGDDGTTGLYFGGRVRKDDAAPRAYGAVDEAQAAIGLARAEAERDSERDSELDRVLLDVERDLYIVMAELATLPENQRKLTERVTADMVGQLERVTDDVCTRFEMPKGFVLPGQDRTSALLEVARTVVRRAERDSLAVAGEGSQAVPYLNRLSSLLWALARWQEGEAVMARDHQNTATAAARKGREAPREET